jgi:hypothetical protein
VSTPQAIQFYGSFDAVDKAQFIASFEPTLDPVGDAQDWIDTNTPAINALGVTSLYQLTEGQQISLIHSHVVPTQAPGAAAASGSSTSPWTSLGSLFGISLPSFSGSIRHFVMRVVEVVLGVVLVGVAIKGFTS